MDYNAGQMQILSDGSYAIDDVISIPGEGISPFIFARGWLLEIIEIESGEFYFICDGSRTTPDSRRFGVFYPPFNFVRSGVKDMKGVVHGIGWTEVIPGLPAGPVIFGTNFRGPFTSTQDAITILDSAQNIHSIDTNSNPSFLSIKTKRLIDNNYLYFPSIARIADRLGVSHAHLSRQFKRDFEMTPSEYLHHLRVADATLRLSVGEPIIEISQDVGYNDLSRFYKQFRKTTNTSPGACRKSLTSKSMSKNAKTERA